MIMTDKFEALAFEARRKLAQVSEGPEEGMVRPESLRSPAALERRGHVGITRDLARASGDELGSRQFQIGTRSPSRTIRPPSKDANQVASRPFLIGSPKLLEITPTHTKQSIEVVSNRVTFATPDSNVTLFSGSFAHV